MTEIRFSSPVPIPARFQSFSHSHVEPAEPLSPAASFLTAFSPIATPQVIQEDEEGSIIAGYTLGPLIAHGAFSTIRLASSSSSNGLVAVKIVPNKPAQNSRDITNESEVWGSLSHEHLLPLFSTTVTLYATYYFTLYCPAGSLLDIVKRHGPSNTIPQDDAGMMFRQVVRGLRYMHQVAGYVHCDIKLENVLVDEMGVCKIADFGLTKRISSDNDDVPAADDSDGSNSDWDDSPVSSRRGVHHLSLMRKKRNGRPLVHRQTTTDIPTSYPAPSYHSGSLPYAAPELLAPSDFLPDSHRRTHASPAQDIWALGVLLFVLLTGKMPFSDSFEPRLMMKILRGTYTIRPELSIGLGAERVLKGCLEKSVKQRWTIEMVDEVGWGVGWADAAWEEQPEATDEWKPSSPTPTPGPVPSALVSRSKSRSRARERQLHDPVPMTAESRSKSRSRLRYSCDSSIKTKEIDADKWNAEEWASSSRRGNGSPRSQSRHRPSLDPSPEEDDVEDDALIRPSLTASQAYTGISRGRRTERKFIPNDLLTSPDQLMTALIISDNAGPSPLSSNDSDSSSPSPSLDSPSSSLILPPCSVRVVRSTSGTRNRGARRSSERGAVRFEDSAPDFAVKH